MSHEARRDSIRRFDLIAEIAGGVGVVSLAAGAYFWLQGPSPGIYDRYKPNTDVGVAVQVLPGAKGAQVVVGMPLGVGP